MLVPKGYKQTELGIIPEDWEVNQLKEFANIFRGGSPRPIQSYLTNSKNGINWIKIGDVLSGNKYINSTKEKIILEGKYSSREVFVGDLILSNSMSFGRPYILNIKGCIHDGWLVIQNYHKKLEKEYFYYILSCKQTIKQYKNLASGSSVLNLNKEKVGAVSFIIPQIKEQVRIGEALSNTDNLIESLEKLIDKKKLIKQGTMQELLTGKKRLKRFSGNWIERELEDLAKIEKGKQANKSTLEQLQKGILYPVINGGILPSGYFDRYNYKKNKITISEGGNSCGYVSFQKQNFWAGGHCYVLQNVKISISYLFQYLKYKEPSLQKLRVGSGLPNIQLKNLYKERVILPPTKQEQEAIANILSDIDDEIEALEKKLAKYRQIKQGMMNELLSGRIRLLGNNSKSKENTKAKSKDISHNQQFDDAALVSAIVNDFYHPKYYLGRKKVQKLMYLLKRKEKSDISAFHKKAAGPYNESMRYKGGERIAINKGYIEEQKSKKGSVFSVGKNIKEALGYIKEWEKEYLIEWLSNNFKFTKVNTLEVLATVDMAMCELKEKSSPINLESIKDFIYNTKEWKNKLIEKDYFTDIEIINAINLSRKLFS